MPAEWLSSSSGVPGRLSQALEGGLYQLARPARLRLLRRTLLALFALWAVVALARLVWALVPAAATAVPDDLPIINPVTAPPPSDTGDEVDIERMVGWHLFGEAGAEAPLAPVLEQPVEAQAAVRDGIEKGARESRLDLKLRGVVASTEDGLGHAIIEYQKRQSVYAVDDELPVPGDVVLAKVMQRQVVLDNGGTYELLTLFEESDLGSGVPAAPARNPPVVQPAAVVDKRVESDTTALARSYRDQLYEDPQSLADVVSINAVRENGQLLGYRVAPGRKREQFEQLGFRAGDLVTGINGISLDDPANTMRLYQTMRTASEAVFELQREQQQLTLSVSLDESLAGP